MHQNHKGQLSVAFKVIQLLYKCSPFYFWLCVVSSIIQLAFYPLFLFILRQSLNQLTRDLVGRDLIESFGGTMLLLLGSIGLSLLAGVAKHTATTVLRQEAWVVITRSVMEKLPTIPYPLFESNDFQATYGLAIQRAALQMGTLIDSLVNTLTQIITLLTLIVALLYIAPVLVIDLFLALLPGLLVEARFSTSNLLFQVFSAPALVRMQYLAQAQIDALWQRDIRVYQSTVLTEEYALLASDYISRFKRLVRRFMTMRLAAVFIEVIGILASFVFTLLLLQHGQITLPTIGALIPGIYFLISSGQLVSTNYGMLSESIGHAEKVFDFLSKLFPQEEPSTFTTASIEAIPQLKDQNVIRFDNVSYTYPESQKVALSDITYDFKVGITAIVGPNGSGKSTLVKLLSGLVQPSFGSISSEPQLTLNTMPKSVLFQDPSHFYLSIRQNVTMRHERCNGEEQNIEQVLRQAGLWDVVKALPDGIDTIVGAGFGGSRDLSGGQWQRLAIARLLFHNSPLIILDEPSASLDPKGEQEIFDLLSLLSNEKIVIFTTHRYNTIRKANTIIVLVDGRITEIGKHEELLRRERDYWSLYMSQITHL
jgi:ATP-binding cassette subfamily B protein